jgi:hypothetical protein
VVTKPPRELAARCESMPFIRSGGRRRYGVRHRSRGNSEVTVVMLFTPPKLTGQKTVGAERGEIGHAPGEDEHAH